MDQSLGLSDRELWPLTSARDAAHELVRLVRGAAPEGWSYREASPARPDVDLRGHPELDVLPLVLPDGSTIGTIHFPRVPTGDRVDAVLRALVQTVVLLIAMERRGWAAVDRAALFERESRLDPLTGLPNRRLWDEALGQEQARCDRHGLTALVAVVDLDSLKETNDQQGHLAGDVLLRMTAQALCDGVRDSDLVARMGGDEFAILAVEFGDEDPAHFAARIESGLAGAGIAASVGVAMATPPARLADAYDEADRAMYTIKRRRKP